MGIGHAHGLSITVRAVKSVPGPGPRFPKGPKRAGFLAFLALLGEWVENCALIVEADV